MSDYNALELLSGHDWNVNGSPDSWNPIPVQLMWIPYALSTWIPRSLTCNQPRLLNLVSVSYGPA